jgi:hypothetical protein
MLRERAGRGQSEQQLLMQLHQRLAWLMAPTQEGRAHTPDFKCAHLLQDSIREVARTLDQPGWSAYLVGGTLRDLLTRPGDGDPVLQPRDIDIVVGGATRENLKRLLQDKLALERLTRFGGLHFSKLLSGSRVLFDIWTLSDTWGFGSLKIAPRIENFPRTTFLNIDSCAIELLQPTGKQRACFERGFFASMANHVLDVNYAPNPYPYVCVARALVMAARLEFTVTRTLAEFILNHTGAGGIGAIIEAQQSHYGIVRCNAAELGTWIDGIRRQFDSGQSTISVEVSEARRSKLWHDYPAVDGCTEQSPNRSLISA